MTRVWTALLLLCVTAALCGGVIWGQTAVTEQLLAEMDSVQALYDEEAPQACAEAAHQLSESFEQKTAWFPLFFNHHEMTEMHTTLSSLPDMLLYGEPEEFPAALQKCRRQLALFQRQELPLIGNVL